MKYFTTVEGQEYIIEIDQEGEIIVNGDRYQVNFQQLPGGGPISLLFDNRSLEAIVSEQETTWEVLLHGDLYSVQVQDERAYRLAQARGSLVDESGEIAVQAPMPGLILNVLVEEGATVEKGETVVILESMKMENELRANRAGLVKKVLVGKGQSVDKNQDLVVIGDAEDDE